MELYRDILLLGWPLWIGLAALTAVGLSLKERLAATKGVSPLLARAVSYFAEGDVVRGLVLLEGEPHPAGWVFSAFWKSIPSPRQREGTALIGEYQKLRPRLLAPLRRDPVRFGRLLLIVVVVQLAWIAATHPQVVSAGPDPTVAGVGLMLLATIIGSMRLLAILQLQLRTITHEADAAVYHAITLLTQGRLPGGREVRIAVGSGPEAERPPHFASRAYGSDTTSLGPQ